MQFGGCRRHARHRNSQRHSVVERLARIALPVQSLRFTSATNRSQSKLEDAREPVGRAARIHSFTDGSIKRLGVFTTTPGPSAQKLLVDRDGTVLLTAQVGSSYFEATELSLDASGDRVQMGRSLMIRGVSVGQLVVDRASYRLVLGAANPTGYSVGTSLPWGTGPTSLASFF